MPPTEEGTVPLDAGASGPIRLGSLTFAWGPYRVQRVAQPNVYRQQGINAWLLNDYGMLPTTYTLVGFGTESAAPYWPDPTIIDQIGAVFAAQWAVKLQCPYQGIAAMVRLVRLTDETDSSTQGPGEVLFTAELEEADGVFTTREGN